MAMTTAALEATDLIHPVRMGRPVALRHVAEVEWHVVEGASLIARQQRIVANLERTGRDASAAREILQTLECRQALEEQYLEGIRTDLGNAVGYNASTHPVCDLATAAAEVKP